MDLITHNDRTRRRGAALEWASIRATLDGLAQRLSMPLQLFQHFKRHLRTSEVSPGSLARQLLDFGRPLVTAQQASELLEFLRGRGEADYRYYHVLCSRVVDPWNLTQDSHGIGACYYGFLDMAQDERRRHHVFSFVGDTDLETLAAVYWGLLYRRVKFDRGIPQWALGARETDPLNHENFWDKDLLDFIRADMHEHAVDTALDVVMTCDLRDDGIVSCTDPAGELIGEFLVPTGEDPFGRWLRDSIDMAMSGHCGCGVAVAAGGLGTRVCLVKPSGEMIWRGTAPSAFEKVCWRLRQFA